MTGPEKWVAAEAQARRPGQIQKIGTSRQTPAASAGSVLERVASACGRLGSMLDLNRQSDYGGNCFEAAARTACGLQGVEAKAQEERTQQA
jgi:hypothetical protein